MSQPTHVVPIAARRVVYSTPEMDAVAVNKGLLYRTHDSIALEMDVYYPPDPPGDLLPAVVLATGFSDAGALRVFGCRFKDMGAFVSWAQLIAASGAVAITYVNSHPETDVHAVLAHVRANAASLGIDRRRLAMWSCSGHGPTALSVLFASEPGDGLQCVVLSNPYTLDLDGGTNVRQAARQFGFADACAGQSVADLPSHVPLLVVRAGQDAMPGLNASLDQFVARALAANVPLTLVNHANAPHAFDVLDDSDATREAIKQILQFIRARLQALPASTTQV
jgi:dienelactone hydrolase